MNKATTRKVGWREWVALPELNISAIKAKVDTGAKTSALHAFKVETFTKSGKEFVRFWIHPLQNRNDVEITCETELQEMRLVRDSGGHTEERHVIVTPINLNGHEWPIEITLTSREDMLFRMLLGRTALVAGNLIVNPAASYLTEHKPIPDAVNVQKKKESK